MCGRYELSQTRERIPAWYRIDHLPDYEEGEARPRAHHPIIRLGREGQRECANALWWFVAPFAKDLPSAFKYTTFNAKSETVDTSPTFRAAYRRQHALIPVSSVIEWEAEPSLPRGKKRKFRVSAADGGLLTLAGLWGSWRDPVSGDVLDCYTIITCEPNGVFRSIPHHRMPVVVAPDHFDWWLDAAQDGRALLQPCADDQLVVTEITGDG